MRILLDCRPLQYAGLDSEKSRLIFSIAAALSRDQNLKWLLVADDNGVPGFLPHLPESEMVVKRALPGTIGWKFWYDLQIPRMAKKHGVDLMMLTGGVAAGSQRVPQCIWMPERANPKGSGRRLPLYAGRLVESLRRAGTVFCFSQRDRDWLASVDKEAADKLVILHPSPATAVERLSMADRENVKAQFAQGREYFFADITAARDEEVISLLKAFSFFKKRQLSNLQLLLLGQLSGGLRERMETYKYREDVQWCSPGVEQVGRLRAGAYAALFLFDDGSLGASLLSAWKAGVPVILRAGHPLQEMAGDAALVADGADAASLAQHLMTMYKDEALRGGLIARGLARVAEFSMEQGINAVRSAIGRLSGINH